MAMYRMFFFPPYYSLLFKFCSEVVHDLTINTCDNN